MRRTVGLNISILFLGTMASTGAIADQCPPQKGSAVQILGSGGPIADDGRASAAYLVWVDGKSRVLIDAGGGAFLRFAEAGANFRDLDIIGISHFHADHSADLPALLKNGFFSERQRPLIVAGPGGGGPFPGLGRFLTSMLSKDVGAFGYLAGYLNGTSGLPRLASIEIPTENTGEVSVLGDQNAPIRIDAMHVPHGIVPALAFRVRIGKDTVVFASDQNGNNKEFVKFAMGSTILLMHMPVPEGVTGAGRSLHAPPNVIGTIANDASAKMLVLSHFMARSLRDLDQNVSAIRSNFSGPIEIGQDLTCYNFANEEN